MTGLKVRELLLMYVTALIAAANRLWAKGRPFAMIQIRQPKQSATIILLDFLLAHWRRPPHAAPWHYRRMPLIATRSTSRIGSACGDTTAEIKADMGRR